jgi:hypothetical protein
LESKLESKVEWYRSRAADCITLAATAPTPDAKATLEDMAARWLRIAAAAEMRLPSCGIDLDPARPGLLFHYGLTSLVSSPAAPERTANAD